MVIIDTNILIQVFRKNRNISQKCLEIGIDNLLTPVAYAEFMVGANKNSHIYMDRFLSIYPILDFKPEIGQIFMNIYKEYSLSHRPQIPDMLIAAFAIYYKVPLFTLNLRHFNFIDDLQLVEIQ